MRQNTKKNVKTARLILLILMLLPLTTKAQGGESAFNFLRLPYSSRVAALGGSNITVIDDDLSLSMHNPALLINTADKTVDLSFMTYMSGSKVAGAAFNKTFGQRSSGAVALRYADYGKFEGYTPDNIFTGTFRAMDTELSLTYCYLLSEHWSGGVAGKFIYSQYESLNSLAIGVDLGLNYYNPEIDFSASLVFKNLGGQVMTFEEEHEIMPIDIQLGITKRLAHAPILLSATFTDLHRWKSTLPTVDNLYALGALLDVPLEEILVPCKPKLNMVSNGQQDVSCCPPLLPGSFECGRTLIPCHQFAREFLPAA